MANVKLVCLTCGAYTNNFAPSGAESQSTCPKCWLSGEAIDVFGQKEPVSRESAKESIERAISVGGEWVNKDGSDMEADGYEELLAEVRAENGEGDPGMRR